MTDATDQRGDDDEEGRSRCDFCRMPIQSSTVTLSLDGDTYAFCTEACRDAMRDSDRVFTEYRGHRWFRSGVSALDTHLPQGLLRNSFILLSGQPGTRDGALHAEIIWRTLQRGEPAIFITFDEPPISIVERFLTLEWNVLPYLESKQLHILDCFTYRVQDRTRMLDRMSEWNRHIYSITEPTTTSVHDPTEVSQLESKLDTCLDQMGMVDTGIVLFDSLTEFGTLLQPIQAYNLVKDIRADVCKGRFVPMFAGATVRSDADEFPHDLEYMVDGIVDLRLNPEIVEDTLIKQIRIRKMSDVLSIPEWTAYEFTSEQGIVTFDPREEIKKAQAKRDAEADEDEDEDVDTSAETEDASGGDDTDTDGEDG